MVGTGEIAVLFTHPIISRRLPPPRQKRDSFLCSRRSRRRRRRRLAAKLLPDESAKLRFFRNAQKFSRGKPGVGIFPFFHFFYFPPFLAGPNNTLPFHFGLGRGNCVLRRVGMRAQAKWGKEVGGGRDFFGLSKWFECCGANQTAKPVQYTVYIRPFSLMFYSLQTRDFDRRTQRTSFVLII